MSDREGAPARIGQFHVVRRLVSGPGAQLAEACADDGSQVLLQIVRLRAPRVQEVEALHAVVGRMERGALEMGALNAGHDTHDGETLVYFASRWDDRAARLGSVDLESCDDLISVGIHLAKRLYDLHRAHRVDALLSERFLIIDGGVPHVLVLPIRPPDPWLAQGQRPAKLAPEETLAKEATQAGDIWRLGQLLKALTANLDRLPTRIWRALELLGHPDVQIRLRTAAEALRMMEALADPNAPDPPSESDLTRARSATEPFEPAVDDVVTISDQPLVAGPRRLPRIDTDPNAAVESATTDPIGVQRHDTVHDEESLPARRVVGAPTAPASKIPEMRRKRSTSWVPPLHGPTGTVMDAPPRALVKRRTGTKPNEPAREPRLLPPPSGAPIDVGPSGTLVGGVDAAIAGVQRAGEPVVAKRAPRAEEPPVEPAEQSDVVRPHADVSSARLWATAVLTFVLGLALGSVALETLEAIEDADLMRPAVMIGPAGSVRVEATPENAIFVGERDGRLLGKPPIDVQVPPSTDVAILVAAPGHEPIRVVLPDRGRISVMLEPNPDPDPCIVSLHIPGGAPIEGVAGAPGELGSGLEIMGAAVIRTTDGRGAWLVRCPDLGGEGVQSLEGRALPPDVELRVSKPIDMEVWIDGDLAGTSPLRRRMTPGFKRIRMIAGDGAAIDRWVPAFSDLDLELPPPRKD